MASELSERDDRPTGAERTGLSSCVYLPALLVPAVAAALIGVGWWGGFGGADFGGYFSSVRSIVVGPVSLAVIGAFLIAERARPAQRRPLVARGHVHDLVFTVFTAIVVIPLVTALTL